mmetsp:Transcript_58622/g.143353  ORF Transcript_58622/g.143353 Transcript_58622/m.143353 type:complete len:91 (+) Transcript_58622:410-682(+)
MRTQRVNIFQDILNLPLNECLDSKSDVESVNSGCSVRSELLCGLQHNGSALYLLDREERKFLSTKQQLVTTVPDQVIIGVDILDGTIRRK